MVDQMFWSKLQLSFHLQTRHVTIQSPPTVIGIKQEQDNRNNMDNAVILYGMKFIDLKVFLVPPVLEWDLTNQSVKL